MLDEKSVIDIAAHLAGNQKRVGPGGIPVDQRSRFHRERYAEIEPAPVAWLRKGLLPAQGVAILYGASQGRKTFVLMDWGFRISAGLPVLDRKGERAGVVYIAAEDAAGVRTRLAAWRQENPGVDCLFDLISARPDLMADDEVEDLCAELRQAAAECGEHGARLGLVVIDTLAKAMTGDANAPRDMGLVMRAAERIAVETGALVVFAAHPGKDEARGPSGWYGQIGGSDVLIHLTREGDLSTLRFEKIKNGVSGQTFSFTTRVVSLGRDRDGDPVTSLVVEYEDAAPWRRPGLKLGAKEAQVLAALEACTEVAALSGESGESGDGHQTPSHFTRHHQTGRPVRVPMDSLKRYLESASFAWEGETERARNKSLYSTLDQLVTKRLIGKAEGAVWLR